MRHLKIYENYGSKTNNNNDEDFLKSEEDIFTCSDCVEKD